MSVSKRITIAILCFSLIAGFGFWIANEPLNISTHTNSASIKTVIIDAGHAALRNTID